MKNRSVLIVGLGKSGLSVARYLHKHQIKFSVTDSRENPPGLSEIPKIDPDIDILTDYCGEAFREFDVLIVSPGISVKDPAVQAAKNGGALVVGDIELFTWEVTSPVLSVTGSNGKSTVVAMLEAMSQQSGKNAKACGNIGAPALDHVDDKSIELFILELSSFQLETTYSLKSIAACILNISEDHMDRYDSLQEYAEAKQRVYEYAECLIVNRSDRRTWPTNNHASVKTVYYADDNPIQKDVFGLSEMDNQVCLMLGDEKIMTEDELNIAGRHNAVNALAAIALGREAGFTTSDMVTALKVFKGLPHRMEFVFEIAGVKWFNDSKGTNVDATVQAVTGIKSPIVLVAGGVGKGADFTPLARVAKKHIKAAVLIGRDATLIADVLNDSGIPVMFASTMEEAVKNAASLANSGDVVLLSPACASFDMFKNFEERGQVFVKEVSELVA